MTSRHCEKCGYPLFEKDGKIICANCTEEEEESSQLATDAALHLKRAELLTRLSETKDLNEIEHILKCLHFIKELI